MKFQAPLVQIDLIERSELIARLNAGAHRKCTLVRAPAGYGKTTLLAQWQIDLNGRSISNLWISLDEEDGAPHRFAMSLAECMAILRNEADYSARSSLHTYADVRSAIRTVEQLILQLSRRVGKAVIFLDDYNRAQTPGLDTLLGHVLARLPANLHVVVVSRTAPEITFAMLRAQGQLNEIGADDLAFSGDQVCQFLLPYYPSEEIVTVHEWLAGWPIAVQLLRLCANQHAAPRNLAGMVEASRSNLAEYLTRQVMTRLSISAQELLIDTAIVEEVHTDLANAICARLDGAELLDEIRGKLDALVRPVGGDGLWLRLHQILRDYLARRLEAGGAERRSMLHIRASQWFEERRWHAQAVRHAAKAGDYVRVARLIENAGAVRIALVESIDELERLLASVPLATIYEHPRLQVARAWCLAKRGQLREARECYDAVRKLVDETTDITLRREGQFVDSMMRTVFQDQALLPSILSDAESLTQDVPAIDHWFLGWINNLLCAVHARQGSFDLALADASKAISHYRTAGSEYGVIFMHLHEALIHVSVGHLRRADVAIESASGATHRQFERDHCLASLVDVAQARLLYERNDIGGARRLLSGALAEVEHSEGWVDIFACGFETMARIVFAEDGLQRSVEILNDGRTVAVDRQLPRLLWIIDCCHVELLTLDGRLEDAETLASSANSFLEAGLPDFISPREKERALIARARLDVHKGRAAVALRNLGGFRPAQEGTCPRAILEVAVMEALAHHAVDAPEEAARALDRALRIAVPEGFLRLFIDHGQRMADLLHDVVRRTGVAKMRPESVDFIAKTLSSIKHPYHSSHPQSERTSHILSAREIEVLRELANGDATKVAARRLQVSDATVKFHLASIYKKFGVNSRKLAIAVGRDYKLI